MRFLYKNDFKRKFSRLITKLNIALSIFKLKIINNKKIRSQIINFRNFFENFYVKTEF